MHLSDGIRFADNHHPMDILPSDRGVLQTRRERIRRLSDRLLFTADHATRNSLLVHLRIEILEARIIRHAHEPAQCPRCLEEEGQLTENTADLRHHLYSCASCGQVWIVKIARSVVHEPDTVTVD